MRVGSWPWLCPQRILTAPIHLTDEQLTEVMRLAGPLHVDLFGVVLSGAVKIEIKQTYPLKDAARAHRDLEWRKTVGSTVLTVRAKQPGH